MNTMKKNNANQNLNLNMVNKTGFNAGAPLQTNNNPAQFNNYNYTLNNKVQLTQDKKINIPKPNKYK